MILLQYPLKHCYEILQMTLNILPKVRLSTCYFDVEVTSGWFDVDTGRSAVSSSRPRALNGPRANTTESQCK